MDELKEIKQAADRLVWILQQADHTVQVEDNEEEGTMVSTVSGAMVNVIMGEREALSILGKKVIPCIVYDLGYMKTYGGGYWEPEDYEFYATESTPSVWDAAEYCLLFSRRREVSCILEAISHQERIPVEGV